MKRDYLSEKAAKKKVTREAMWILLIFILLFLGVMFRIAWRSESAGGFFSSMPSGDDAFEIAKDYIMPTLRSANVEFNKDYQYAKSSDSVYVVKSYFQAKDSVGGNGNVKTNYTITIKYNGGTVSNDRNWSLLNLQEN
jgi:hypothetical protein